MYNKIGNKKSKMKGIQGYDADSIEEKVRKIMNSKEPITDGAPLIYTERKEGVKPSYNIRTDRLDSFHVHLTYQQLQQPQQRCLI